MPLDPIIATFYREQLRHRQKPQKNPVLRRQRAAELDAAGAEVYVIPGPDVRTEDVVIPVTGYPDVRLRLRYPLKQGEGGRLHPGYLVFFGGAFRQGGIDYPSNVAAYSSRTAEAEVVTIAVDYALAPEHTWPTAVEQGHAALEWLIAHGHEHGIDPSRLAIGGQSSGGNIAACVTLMNRDRANHPLRLQLLEVPSLDLTRRSIDLAPARELHIPGFLITRGMVDVLKDYFDNYRTDALSPYASPLLAPSLAGLPAAYVLTAEYDPLRGDGEKYAARIRREGGDASAVRYLGQVHESPGFTRVLPGARHWHRDIVAILRTLHDD